MQSRAELEALILQQRSAQASSVDSPPSTSSSHPAAAQLPQGRQRVVKALPAPKQATRQKPAPAAEAAPGAQPGSGEAAGSSRASAGVAASAVELSAASGGSSPFASITGRGTKSRRKGSNTAETAWVRAANGKEPHSSNNQEEHAGVGAGTGSAYFGNGSSARDHANGGSGAADVKSGFSTEKDQHRDSVSRQKHELQPGTDDQQSTPQAHNSRTEEQDGGQLDGLSFNEWMANGQSEAGSAEQHAGEPSRTPASSRVGSVTWLRPKFGMAPPLQVRKGMPLDVLRQNPASRKAIPQGVAAVGDRAAVAVAAPAVAEAEESSAVPAQHADAGVAPAALTEQADSVTGMDVDVMGDDVPVDDSGSSDTHEPAANADGSPDASAESLPQPPSDDESALAHESVAVVSSGEFKRSGPSAHEVFGSLIRQRQEEKALRPRPAWSNQSWDARWHGGPEGEMHQHGGSRSLHQPEWQRLREPLRRTTRSSLRHGRATVQVTLNFSSTCNCCLI